MSILLERGTRVVVQGLTGRTGRYQLDRMRRSGTTIVAGTRFGGAGTEVGGVPIFNTVQQAAEEVGADLCVSYVPGERARESMSDCLASSVSTVVCIGEFVPLRDTQWIRSAALESGKVLVGPNSPGICSPGEGRVGFFSDELAVPGTIGVASRSGTLTYAAMIALREAGLGVSTAVGIGGNVVRGIGFVECMQLFERDERTQGVVLLGEVGGAEEERAAAYGEAGMSKPTVAFVVGRHAPPGVAMGHAGAVVSGGRGGAEAKIEAFRSAGIPVAETLDDIPRILQDLMKVG